MHLINVVLVLNLQLIFGIVPLPNVTLSNKFVLVINGSWTKYYSSDPVLTYPWDCVKKKEFYNPYGPPCARDCILYRIPTLPCRGHYTPVSGCFCKTQYVRAGVAGDCVTLEECLSYDLVLQDHHEINRDNNIFTELSFD